MPKPGDRFEGIIFSLEGRTALIELPGLDPDTQAYGVVGPEDNPGGTRLRENQVVTCEVIAVEQERQNYLCVRCRIG